MRRFLCVLMTFTMLLGLAACAAGSPAPAASEEKEEYLGRYYLAARNGSSDGIGDGSVRLGSESEVLLILNGEKQSGRWKLKNGSLTLKLDGDTYEGTLEDEEMLLLDIDGVRYLFIKGRDAAEKYISLHSGIPEASRSGETESAPPAPSESIPRETAESYPETTTAIPWETAESYPETTAGSTDGETDPDSPLLFFNGGECPGSSLLTSIGQSTDANIINVACGKLNIRNVTLDNAVTADKLTGEYQNLILAVGGSTKGLGMAGLDKEEELDRAVALVERARALGMKIIFMHIGGDNRRGALSDYFIGPMLYLSDYAILVSGGDDDGMMKNILSSEGIPCSYSNTDILEAGTALRSLLGQ